MALIGSISSSSVVPNTAISGTITSSQIGANALTANNFPQSLDIRGKGILLEPLVYVLYTTDRWVLWWPKSYDGIQYHGVLTMTNYTSPAYYDVGLHNIWNNNTGVFIGITRMYGSQNVSWRRVTYNGVQYVATYNAGETNREYIFSGWQYAGRNFAPFAVASVTTDHETYATP